MLRRGIPDRHLQTAISNRVHQTSGLSTGLSSHPRRGERSVYYCIEGEVDAENVVPPVNFQSIISQYCQYQSAKSSLNELETPYIESQNRINSTKDEKMSVTGWRGDSGVEGVRVGFLLLRGAKDARGFFAQR